MLLEMSLALDLGPGMGKDLESEESLAPKMEDLHGLKKEVIFQTIRFGNGHHQLKDLKKVSE